MTESKDIEELKNAVVEAVKILKVRKHMNVDDIIKSIYNKKVSEIVDHMNKIGADKFSQTFEDDDKVVGAIIFVRGDKAEEIVKCVDRFDELENTLPSPDELMKKVNQLTKFIKGNCVDLDWRDATHLESEISTKARKILNINR